MKKHFKSLLLSFITAITTASATAIVAYVKSLNLIDAFVVVYNSVISGIAAFLTFEIKLWWLLTGIAVLVLVIYVDSKFPSKHVQDNFRKYTSDTIDGIKWQWRWYFNSFYQQNMITNLRSLCIHCHAELVEKYDYYNHRLECVICGSKKHVDNLEDFKHKIEIEINRRVRTGEYKKEAG